MSQPAALPAARAGYFRAIPWTARDVAAAVVFGILLKLVGDRFIDQAAAALLGGAGPVLEVGSRTLVAQMLRFAFVVGIVVAIRHGTMGDLGWRRPSGTSWPLIALLGVAVAVGLEAIANGLAGALFNIHYTGCNQFSVFGRSVLQYTPFDCLLVPVVEETVYRGFLYGWFRKHTGVAAATLASAAIFAVAHANINSALILPVFVIGIVLALVYERTRSLGPGMLAHGVINFLAIGACAVTLH